MFWVTIASAVFGLVALVVSIVSNQLGVILALTAVILFLFAIIFYVGYVINKLIKYSYPSEFLIHSQFTKYVFSDETHVVLDSYRLIQSKKTLLPAIKWGFIWTGRNDPRISSNLQDCDGTIIKRQSVGDYDHVLLKFKNPLFYNESAVVHFHAEMTDEEKIAQPHLDVKIETPRSVVDYRVILAYKDDGYSKKAVFKKKLINSLTPAEYEEICEVPFNPVSKSYEHVLTDPEIGYYYRLEWER